MPENPEIELDKLKERIRDIVRKFRGEVGKEEEEAIAFGLKALKVIFVIDENEGSTDKLEREIQKLEGVRSVETVDVRRAIG